MENEKDISVDQFDIVWLLKYLLSKWKFILISTGVAVLVCVVYCLIKPAVYTAKASILPISEEQSMLSGNVGALASMAGVNLGSNNSSGSIITSDLYPKVSESIPFLSEMVNVKVPWDGMDSLMSYYEYALIDTIPTLGQTIKKYTIGLPGVIVSAFSSEKPAAKSEADISKTPETSYLIVDSKRMSAISKMRGMVKVKDEPKYGTIEVSVDATSPEQASILTTAALSMIQNTVTEHKTRRAKDILKFAEERYAEAMTEYESIYQKYSTYKDTHRDMIAERMGSEYQKLSDKYDLSRSILNTISSQVEQARLEVMQNTPVFTVIDPVVLPREKSSPQMSIHIIVGILLGSIGSLGWLMVRLAWWQVFDEKKISALQEKMANASNSAA